MDEVREVWIYRWADILSGGTRRGKNQGRERAGEGGTEGVG